LKIPYDELPPTLAFNFNLHPYIMGVTSENVAEKWSISRTTQDTLAARSHARAAAARANGRFDSQIVPVHTFHKDPKTGEKTNVVISQAWGALRTRARPTLNILLLLFLRASTRAVTLKVTVNHFLISVGVLVVNDPPGRTTASATASRWRCWQGLANIARHVIQRTLHPRLLS
jgi:hypothetical protein